MKKKTKIWEKIKKWERKKDYLVWKAIDKEEMRKYKPSTNKGVYNIN